MQNMEEYLSDSVALLSHIKAVRRSGQKVIVSATPIEIMMGRGLTPLEFQMVVEARINALIEYCANNGIPCTLSPAGTVIFQSEEDAALFFLKFYRN